ncbi:MAG: hypothetical protein LBU32_23945 [Clostridiales bacterium]|nr:hypothetical protein [Clostridiales bacterium]
MEQRTPHSQKTDLVIIEAYINEAQEMCQALDSQTLTEAVKSIKKISRLHKNNSKVVMLQNCYALALSKIIKLQDLADAKATGETLIEFAQKHPDNYEIHPAFAEGMAALAEKKDWASGAEAVDNLSKLYLLHLDDAFYAQQYAKGIASHTTESVASQVAAIESIESLFERFPESIELASTISGALFKLSTLESGEDRANTINKLEKLATRFPSSAKAAKDLGKALIELLKEQETEEADLTLRRLSNLGVSFPQAPEAVEAFSEGIYEFSQKDGSKNIAECVGMIAELYEVHPDSKAIAINYTKALVSLSYTQSNYEDIKRTFDKIAEMSVLHLNSAEFVQSYALGLVNLLAKQTGAEAEATADLLSKCYMSHPGNQAITFAYGRGLFCLADRQDVEAAKETLQILRLICIANPKNEQLPVQFAMGVSNIIARDVSCKDIFLTMLNTIMRSHKSNQDLVDVYNRLVKTIIRAGI